MCANETTRYCDTPDKRVLDLRDEGVPWLEVLSRRFIKTMNTGPKMHVHEGCVEIVYCFRGRMVFLTPERRYPFLPGCVFASRDDQPHCMETNPKGAIVYRVLVRLPRKSECFLGLDKVESVWLMRRLLSLPRIRTVNDDRSRGDFDRLFDILDQKEADVVFRRMRLRQAALNLLLGLVDVARSSPGRKAHPTLSEWISQMQSNPFADYSFERICRDVGLSHGGFNRAFGAVAGLPPQAFLRDCRIRRAAEMLKDGLGIGAVALRLHFSSTQHFATAFRRIMGVSPRTWILQNKERNA